MDLLGAIDGLSAALDERDQLCGAIEYERVRPRLRYESDDGGGLSDDARARMDLERDVAAADATIARIRLQLATYEPEAIQRVVHDEMLCATIHHIVGKELYERHADYFNRRYCANVLRGARRSLWVGIEVARRAGKTYANAQFCAALITQVPGISIGVFAQVGRIAQLFLSHVKNYVERFRRSPAFCAPGGVSAAELRLGYNKTEHVQIEHASAVKPSIVRGYAAKPDVRRAVFAVRAGWVCPVRKCTRASGRAARCTAARACAAATVRRSARRRSSRCSSRRSCCVSPR